MWRRWIGRVGFWASLLLTLCVLDATRGFSRAQGSSPGEAALPTQLRNLTLRIELGEGLSGDPEWETKIYRESEAETRTGRAARAYDLAASVTGKGTGTKRLELPEGAYWVIARAPGFVRVARSVELDGDREVSLQLAAAEPFLVRVLSEKAGELLPLGGATVLVGEPSSLPEGTRTDAQGEARFESLPPGPQRVRIFAPGYEPYEGIAERELLVRLRPVSTLRVRVVDGERPQANAEVFIAGAELWPARAVMTGGEGYVDLAGLRPGKYALYAEKDDRVSQVKSAVEVLPEAGIVEVTLSLFPGVFVAARVQSKEDEKPIAGARVTWSSSGLGQFSRHARSNAEGLVRIGPLSQWGGMLQVRAEGFVPRMVEAELPEGGVASVQVIDLDRAGTIEGRVVDPDGFPVAGATVEIAGTDIFGMPVSISYLSEEIADAHFDWEAESQNVLIPAGELGVMLGPVPPIPLGDVVPTAGRRLSTDEKGYFLATNVPPGELVVLARHPDYMEGKSSVLHLNPGGHVKTTVVLGRGQTLRGRVVDHRGFPLAHARVQITAKGFDRRVSAESDGTFSLGAAPKDVTLRISRPEQPLRVIFSREVRPKERDQEIEIELPEPREPVEMVIKNTEGEPVRLAQVTIVSLSRDVPFKKTLFSSEEGKVSFEEAQGLRARVSVSAPGYVDRDEERVLKKTSEVRLMEALNAVGRITAVRGRQAASGARVTYRSGSVVRSTVADDLGHYRLSGLPPGGGKLAASHEEYGKAEKSVRLKSSPGDRPVELPDLDLEPTLEVSGQVVDAQGRPLAGAVIASSRLSPYLPVGGTEAILGTSDGNGEFRVEVRRQEPLHLFGAALGRGYGFSDPVKNTDLDRVSDVSIIIDREDRAPPEEMGTVLMAIEESARGSIVVYTVAEGSDAFDDGIRPDDVLVEIDGERPEDLDEARQLLSGIPGSDVRLTFRRSGRSVDVYTTREAFMR